MIRSVTSSFHRSYLSRVLLLCGIFLSFINIEAFSQHGRITWGSYFDAHFGINSYGGERGTTGRNSRKSFKNGLGGGFGCEAGFIYTARYSAGLSVHTNRHPQILRNIKTPPPFERISSSTSWDWITVLSLMGRYRLKPELRFSPYIQAGIGTSLTWINDHLIYGLGPRVGAGIDTNIFDNIDAYFEVDAIYIFPGKALDLAGTYFDTDPLGLISLGVRYVIPHRFRKARQPVRLLRIVGPDRLTAGELGMYAVDIDLHDDLGPLEYLWDFGDGTTSSTMIAAHGYVQPGTYTITFTVSNSASEVDRSMTTVVTGPVLLPEIVALQVLPLRPKEGQTIQFSPVFRGTEPYSCNWDFGDGYTSRECFPAHQFVSAGMYSVTLEVTNMGGVDREVHELTVGKDVCLDVSNLLSVYFDQNSSELSIASKEALRENIAQLVGCPEIDLEITGYAVSGERNVDFLSEERGRAVAQYYINLGISIRRITTDGAPAIEDIPTGEAVWQYRRVESVVHRRER